MKIEHVYILVDFSQASLNALRYGALIAKQFNATVHLVHVYERPYITIAQSGVWNLAVDEEQDAAIRHQLYQQLAEVAKQNKKHLQGLTVYEKLIADLPPYKFYEDIKEDKLTHAIAVCGTTGATGIFHGELLGTTAARLIRYAPIPVFVVPVDTMATRIKHVAYPTNFQEDTFPILKRAYDFAKAFKAEFSIIAINRKEDAEFNRYVTERFKETQELLGDSKIRLYIYSHPSVVEGIIETVIVKQVDVVAMFTHGRTGLAHLIKGSITEQVATHLRVAPILALKEIR